MYIREWLRQVCRVAFGCSASYFERYCTHLLMVLIPWHWCWCWRIDIDINLNTDIGIHVGADGDIRIDIVSGTDTHMSSLFIYFILPSITASLENSPNQRTHGVLDHRQPPISTTTTTQQLTATGTSIHCYLFEKLFTVSGPSPPNKGRGVHPTLLCIINSQ